MPLITIFECEPPCGKRIEIGEATPGADEFLQVTDAYGNKFAFHKVECLRKWADTYVCPYLQPEPSKEPN